MIKAEINGGSANLPYEAIAYLKTLCVAWNIIDDIECEEEVAMNLAKIAYVLWINSKDDDISLDDIGYALGKLYESDKFHFSDKASLEIYKQIDEVLGRQKEVKINENKLLLQNN